MANALEAGGSFNLQIRATIFRKQIWRMFDRSIDRSPQLDAKSIKIGLKHFFGLTVTSPSCYVGR